MGPLQHEDTSRWIAGAVFVVDDDFDDTQLVCNVEVELYSIGGLQLTFTFSYEAAESEEEVSFLEEYFTILFILMRVVFILGVVAAVVWFIIM